MDRRAIKLAWLLGLAWGMGLVVCAKALGQQTGFPLTPPEVKRVVVEKVYQFYVMRYNPPLEVPLEEQEAEVYRFRNPDLATMALLAAQAQGHYERYVEGLSAALRAQLEAELARTGRSPKDLIREWQKRFMNRRIELTHHVKYGVYSIIRYRLTPMSEGSAVAEEDLALMVESGKGWAAADLSGDLVYENWDFPDAVKRLTKQ